MIELSWEHLTSVLVDTGVFTYWFRGEGYYPIMSNKNLLARITVDPDICHGKPCLRGLRYPVETVLEYLAGGDSIDDLLAEFPDLEREDILACLEFSRRVLAVKSVHLALT